MNVMEAIERRRSIREYQPDEIPEDVLQRLLNAMRLAPSSHNGQPWKFIVVRRTETKSAVAAACTWKTADGQLLSQEWVDGAPVIIVACGSDKEAAVRYYKDGDVVITGWPALEAELAQGPVEFESALIGDLTIALDHLSLAAASEGLGTCWIGALNENWMREALSIPDGVRAPLAMALGYPTVQPDPTPRKTMDDIVCYDRFC